MAKVYHVLEEKETEKPSNSDEKSACSCAAKRHIFFKKQEKDSA